MQLDDVKKIIQDFFQENTVTVVGSGLSIAEGIPGMSALSSELQSQLPVMLVNKTDLYIWKKIATRLINGEGLEEVLHIEKPTPTVEEKIRATTANFIRKAETNVLREVMTGTRRLRFSEYLRRFNIRNAGITVITTNYDRLIEYACEIEKIRINTLFVGRFFSYFSPDESKYSFCKNIFRRNGKDRVEYSPKVTVLKPHGCLSWYLVDGFPCSIPQVEGNDCLIITPGINKYKEGYNAPFDTHRERANIAIDSALRYIIIGYGFGDDHLETHLVQQLNSNKPALILTHSLSTKALDLVKSCKNITALCCETTGGVVGTKVITSSEEMVFHKINMWDIHEMIKEVF